MKISVFGLFRDSENTLNECLERLDNLQRISNYDFEFFFYENDSHDNTRGILSEWSKGRKAKLYYEDIGTQKYGSVTSNDRIVLLSYYRNKLKRLAGKLDSKFSLLLDTDIVFSNKDVEALIDSLDDQTVAMATANTRQIEIPDVLFNATTDSYYDVFACRDYYFNSCYYFSDCPLILDLDRNRWNENLPVKVSSAFGGLAVAKTKAYNNSQWSTCGSSEHVNFCKEISKFGDISIVPYCKPRAIIDMSTVNPEVVEMCRLRQIKHMKYVQSLFQSSITDRIVFKNV